MRIWFCPECMSSVRAPERPRRDDVRRFCLRCSEKNGRLVERTAPAAEKQRAKKRTATAAKRKAAVATKRERDRAKVTVAGVYLPDEAKRMWRLRTIREIPTRRRDVPEIVYRRSPKKRHSSGYCEWGGRRITMTIGLDEADALGTLLHELVHAALPAYEHHSDRFWSLLRSAAKEAWPDVTFDFAAEAGRTKWERQQIINRGIRRKFAAESSTVDAVE
jgi:hypothetical protein